jgi:hypothetical protein
MKPPVGKTFIVAASLLGLAALVQLVAVLVYFGPGFAPAAAGDPVAGAPAHSAVTMVETAAAEPVPSADEEAEEANNRQRVAELLGEAEELRSGASPDAALVPLEEAEMLEPRNPQVLQELASLHERLGQTELAEAAWRRLADLGEEAGRLAEVAKVRLDLLAPEAGVSGGAVSLRDQVGLQPGSSLGIISLAVTDNDESGALVKELRLAVKARPGEDINARDVKINLTFFVNLEGEITPDTTSRVQSMWFTTPVDWQDDGIEILEVKYEVPRTGPGGELPEYYGYMVNIYHRGQLQETRSDPAALQEMFPPPVTELPDYEDAGFLP